MICLLFHPAWWFAYWNKEVEQWTKQTARMQKSPQD